MAKTRYELKKIIDSEHGNGFNKNIDLSGWTFYRGDSFISFKIVEINKINIVVITYVYITNKNDLSKLLASCINFWIGNKIQSIYFLEHNRQSDYTKKYFKDILNVDTIEEVRKGVWKYPFISNNGYKEDDIIEYFS